MAPTLIYCADGNPRFAEIAIECGFRYGAQLPKTIYHPPYFADQNWRKPDRIAYMKTLAQFRPALATVLDWEHDAQFADVLSWAEEAAQYVETVIIIPKVINGIKRIPRNINGKPVRLGYSASSTFSGTSVPIFDFRGWGVHCLGGSPKTQMQVARYVDVQSCDGNYLQRVARQWGKFFISPGKYGYLRDIGRANEPDGMYKAFRLSCQNVREAWRNN